MKHINGYRVSNQSQLLTLSFFRISFATKEELSKPAENMKYIFFRDARRKVRQSEDGIFEKDGGARSRPLYTLARGTVAATKR